MSLSRPIRFPLLKLPWLCIKCVLHNSDLFDIIYIATISIRTRRIVKASNYPLKEINVYPCGDRRIILGDSMEKPENKKTWHFRHSIYADNGNFVLQRGSQPFCTSRRFDSWRGNLLYSYTTGDTLDALKMGIAFLIDVFGCKIGELYFDDKLSELSGFGTTSAKVLFIFDSEPVNKADLKYLLENIKVSDKYVFHFQTPKDFYCDPQLFKCRQLYFGQNSADWVTLDILCQLDVSILSFYYLRFSKKEIVSYITHWFNSENRKLEYVLFEFKTPALEDFKIDHLNPMPFCEKRRNRWTLNESWENADLSRGKDILRNDGLLATLHAYPTSILFYVWHKRFPDAVQQ